MNDEIVEEVREVRLRLLASCGGDLEALMCRHQEIAAVPSQRLVSLDEFRRRHGRQRPLKSFEMSSVDVQPK